MLTANAINRVEGEALSAMTRASPDELLRAAIRRARATPQIVRVESPVSIAIRDELLDAKSRIADLERENGHLRQECGGLKHLLTALKARRPDSIIVQPEGSPAAYPSIAKIKALICETYRVSMVELDSGRRDAKIVRPRQIAMYLACKLTPNSLPRIGQQFGGRDHTTVLHSRNMMCIRRTKDEALCLELTQLEFKLNGATGA